ncbi:major capsid protein [Zooshikella sp. RANM57]|uniref:major capsid protein n=1 Tax=Zooshikella sp. RANM57 TaxID=3425863 RepID=UPI003D70023C
MTVNIDRDTITLVRTIEFKKKPFPYYLNKYFSSIYESQEEQINFELVFGERRLAPFVSPMLEGRPLPDQGYEVKSFKPAYIKPKNAVKPQPMMKRRVGEAYLGSLSPAQRYNIYKMELFIQQAEAIDNRLEWMAVQSLLYGKVTISGENYPKCEVNYGRNSALTIKAKKPWTDEDALIVDDLEESSVTMASVPGGSQAKDIYFGPAVWKCMRKNKQIRDQLDTQVAGTNASIDRGPQTAADDVVFVGSLGGGRLKLHCDSRQYQDDAGNMQPFLPEGVVMPVGDVEGVQCFGAIMDVKVLRPMRTFPKSWVQEDPSVEYVMTQSAPLVVPARPNGSALLTGVLK